MSELLSIGNSLATSADFSTVAGTPQTLYIKGSDDGPMPTGVSFLLQHKSSGGKYNTVAVLNGTNITQMGTITGAGTFRVQRLASAFSSGMDIE